MEMLRPFWKYIRKHWVASIIIVSVGIIVFILLGYLLKWDWTGFNEHFGPNVQQYQATKTLWDWLQLLAVLAIPVVVGLGAAWFTRVQQQSDTEAAEKRAQTEREIALDNQREAALQAYIDNLSALLLDRALRHAQFDEARTIARVRTLRVLPRLDGERKRNVIQFLHESGLIDKDDFIRVIDLHEADLREACLDDAELEWANLSGAKLMGANLKGSKLMGAKLDRANLSIFHDPKTKKPINTDLSEADLSKATLFNANLEGANLSKAWVTREQVCKAKSLQGATMPDGSIHP
jgi:uncharacterized protein YjbI with pentapeptide repeats